MKKILIALPLVLIMLLSMIPVTAAPTQDDVAVTYYNHAYKHDAAHEIQTKTYKVDFDTEDTPEQIEAKAKAVIEFMGFPDVDGKPAADFEWTVDVTYKPAVPDDKKLDNTGPTGPVTWAMYKDLADSMKIELDTTTNNVDVSGNQWIIDQDAVKELVEAYQNHNTKVVVATAWVGANANDQIVFAHWADVPGTGSPKSFTAIAFPKGPAPTEAPTTEAPTTEAPTTEAPTEEPTTEAPTTEEPTEAPTTEKITCPEACEFITVELSDIHSGRNLAWASKQFKVNNKVAPDFDAILDLYLDQYFPWGNWQPVKNYLNVYSIITPKDIFNCKIIIEVIPKWENIMVIHELWDCCITPDGKVKEELRRSFIEDNKRYETWDPNFIDPATGRTVLSGNSSYGLDGLLPIDFLDFHTDLKVNQEKAAEYAKTRLEKMNAADFVFQHATFYENVRVSNYFTGDVYDLDGNLITTWTDGIPTIVIKYLRAECIKTDEKVDDAKVVAGQAGTTTTPVQQLPATGAKDVTAFFMSAVALLGLGIFFAKKR